VIVQGSLLFASAIITNPISRSWGWARTADRDLGQYAAQRIGLPWSLRPGWRCFRGLRSSSPCSLQLSWAMGCATASIHAN